MTFCLPQPILDLLIAVEIHMNMEDAYENYFKMFFDALLISCTTVAYSLNTIVAMHF